MSKPNTPQLQATRMTGTRPELLQQLAKNFGRSLVQDTSFFKIASAPIASALVVAARVAVALKSAREAEKKEDDPEKVQYAREQALMTITREVAGLVLSFGLMSGLNVSLDAPLQKGFGLRFSRPDVTGPMKAANQFIQILIGRQKEIMVAPEALGVHSVIELAEERGLSPNALQKGMRHLLKPLAFAKERMNEKALMKQGFENLRNFGIPLFSTGLSIYLAGWVLERTALLKTDKIIAGMRQRYHAYKKRKLTEREQQRLDEINRASQAATPEKAAGETQPFGPKALNGPAPKPQLHPVVGVQATGNFRALESVTRLS